MQMHPTNKQNMAFLDKFQGKKNFIKKEGLIQLLDHKNNSNQSKQLQPIEKVKMPLSKQLKMQAAPSTPFDLDKQNHKKLHLLKPQSKKSNSILGHQVRQKPQQQKQQLGHQKSFQQLKNKLKLPAINKSSSYSSSLNKKNTQPNPRDVLQSSSNSKNKSPPSRNQKSEISMLSNYPKKMQLDKYALRHLQFLDKFEKKLLYNQSGNKKTTSKSEFL